MGPVIKLLQAIRGLTKSGGIKKLEDAYRLAQRELGERFSQYQNQIKDAFDQGQKEITKITNKPSAEIIPFQKKEGIESLSKGRVKDKGEVIEASFKPGKDKYGRVVEESPSQAPGTSPVMQRLEKGIETLKEMKQPGMDLTTGLTRTSVRKILDRAGIQVPDKVDPIEVFEKNFGGDALMDVKDVAEEMIELERMGKSLKSMDEILEQSGMFNIKRNPDAPKGLSDEEIERIKKEVDQEKQIKDFDPTDREPNSEGGINRTSFALGGMKAIMAIINQIKKLDPMDAMKEVNKVIAKEGKYKNLSDTETKKIFDDTQDHIFERDVKPKETDVNFDDEVDIEKGLNDLDELNITKDASQVKKMLDNMDDVSGMTPKMVERFKLKERFPGIDDRLLTQIIDDPDPQRKAEAIATIDQAFELMRQGKSQEEVYDIMKQMTDRTKQAGGGLQYLMGL